jgi:ectoine hydroxylase-related dioxygenase (phytanoyl-CoA dioxygenase family)
LIEKSFRVPASELARHGLTFERSDIESYEDLVERFKPSALKLLMPDNHDYFSLWLDPLVLSVIEGYMGFRPVLREAYVRRNFPCSYKVMNHNWHRDTNHQHHLLKAFIFFNDCYVDTGAHRYIAGSVDSPLFRDKIYYSDEEIEAVFPDGTDDHIISEVPAGTIILEDTRGLHKAGIPQRHYRDLGFAVFVPPMLFRDDSEYFAISKSVHASLMPTQQAYIGRSNIIG